MSRKEIIGDATLYLADCRDLLSELAADAVITDPPYGTNVTEWDKSIDAETVSRILATCPDGYSVFFYSNTRLAHLLNAIRDHGHDAWVTAWLKPNAMGFERRFSPQWTPVVVAYRGNPRFWGPDVISCPIVPQKVKHPTPKPLGLMNWLMYRASDVLDVVLDPFMGSGTTGVAAVQAERKFIGIEIEEKYFSIACKRIEEATRQGDLIRDILPKPEQKAMEL